MRLFDMDSREDYLLDGKYKVATPYAPLVDVVEVVRCKDCKNNYNTCINHGINQPMCDFTDRVLKETDFCSRGERREP